MKFKISHLIKTYPITFFAVVALFTASVVTAAKGVLLPLAIGEAALSVVLAVSAILKMHNEFRIIKNAVLSLNASLSDKDMLKFFPLPAIICKANGKILWYNDLFKTNVIRTRQPKEDNISVFTGGTALSELTAGNRFSASYDGRDYTVISGTVDCSGDNCTVLYFVDDTDLKSIDREYRMSKPAVALIAVDSIDEFYRVYKESEYAEITSAVERLTENWFSEFSGVFRKLGTGRFIAIVPESELEKMISKKFNVLENVRTYTYNGATVGITLSAGVGRGDNLSDAESAARQALDMALGRGGDQVAVKDNDKYTFFGGVSKGVEKRTKVRTRVVASAMSELIRNASNVVIMGHKFSDLDSVGAAYGMYKAALALGKDAKIVVNRKTTLAQPLIDFIEKSDDDCFVSPITGERLIVKKTLLIVVDTHKADFVDSKNVYDKAQSVIVIDHHRKTVDYINNAVIFYHEPHASSACEMVTELLQYISKRPVADSLCATALMSGIMLDTKEFVLRAGVRTFEAAAYLRSRGADTVTVKSFFANSMESRKLRGMVVMNAEMYRSCAISVTDIESNDIRVVCAQAADELLSVSGVDASFVIFKTDDIVNISARSMGKVNVQLIMEALGGGGHQTMAAVQLKDVTESEIKDMLKTAIDNYYSNL